MGEMPNDVLKLLELGYKMPYDRLLQQMFLQAYNSIVVTTGSMKAPDPLFVYVNPAFTKMTGYTMEDIKGKSPRILQGPETDRIVIDTLREKCNRGENFQGSTVNYRKDGSKYWVEWNISPIFSEDKELSYFISFQKDVTKQKKMEFELKAANLKYKNLISKLLKHVKKDVTNHDYYDRFQNTFISDMDSVLAEPDEKGTIGATQDLIAAPQLALNVYEFLENDDADDLAEYLHTLSWEGTVLSYTSVDETYIHNIQKLLSKISSIMMYYPETKNLGSSVNVFSIDLENKTADYLLHPKNFMVLINAFIEDLEAWHTSLFSEGAPSPNFMDDSLIASIYTLTGLVQKGDGPGSEEDLDDIFF